MLLDRLRQSPVLAGATVLVLVGGGLDLITTVTLVSLTGVHESNPVAKAMLVHGGGLALVGLKLGAVLFGVWVTHTTLSERLSTETILAFVFATMGVIWLGAGIYNIFITGVIPIIGT